MMLMPPLARTVIELEPEPWNPGLELWLLITLVVAFGLVELAAWLPRGGGTKVPSFARRMLRRRSFDSEGCMR